MLKNAPLNSRPILQSMMSLNDTLYRFEAILNGHQQELKSNPALQDAFAPLKWHPIDVLARLERMKNDAYDLKRELWRARHELFSEARTDRDLTDFDDLSEAEVAGLAAMNTQLQQVTDHTLGLATEIDTTLSTRIKNPADPLWDFYIDAEFDFVLREDDPAFDESQDNYIASVETIPHRDASGRFGFTDDGHWPDGFDRDRLPHDWLFHELLYYGAYGLHEVDLRDLPRIGTVYVDLVVHYQLKYDLLEGKWVTILTDA